MNTSAFRCVAALVFAELLAAAPALADDTVTVGGLTLVSKGLVGVGRIPSDQRDKLREQRARAGRAQTDALGEIFGFAARQAQGALRGEIHRRTNQPCVPVL